MKDNFKKLDRLDNELGRGGIKSVSKKADKKKGVVRDVKKDITEVGQNIATPSNFKNIGVHLLNAMPNSSDLLREIRTLDFVGHDVESEFVKEFAQVTEASKRLTRFVIDKNRRYIPRKLYHRLDNFAKRSAQGGVDEPTIDSRDQEVKDQLDLMFGSAESTEQTLQEANAQRLAAEARRSTSSRKQLELLTKLSKQFRLNTIFHETTHKNYMRKSLELKYQHVYIAKDTLEQVKALNNSLATHLAAIVKNTGIPDTMKYQGIERAKTRIYGSVFNKGMDRLSDIGKNIAERIRTELISQFPDAASAIDMSVDAMEGMEDFGGSKRVSPSARVGSILGRAASDFVGKRLSNRMGKALSYGDLHASSFLKQFASGGNTARLNMESSLNPVVRMLSSFVPSGETSVKMGNSMLNKGAQPAPFDVMTRQSIVEVIPAWLSKIAKNTRDIFTGESTEEETYDVTTRRIVSSRTAVANLGKHVFGSPTTRSSGYLKSVGATLQAIDSSDLVISMDRKTIDQSIGMVIANAIATRTLLHPNYLKPYLYLSSDTELEKNKNIAPLFKGVTNKLITLQALYFTMVKPNGSPDVAVIESINAGIYSEISYGNGSIQTKLATILDEFGYGHLFRDHVEEDGTVSQDWITSEIRNVENRYKPEVKQGRDKYVEEMLGHRENERSVEDLKQKSLTLLNDPKSFGRFDENEQYARYKQADAKAITLLKKVYDGDPVKPEEYLKTIFDDPNKSAGILRDSYNLVQQAKIIQLEKELLKIKDVKSDVPLIPAEQLKYRRMGKVVPDIDFFESSSSDGKKFSSKYGKYGEEHRPYLMDAYNKIKTREHLSEIYTLLKSRLTDIASMAKLRIKLVEEFHGALLTLPQTIISGIEKFGAVIGKTIAAPFLAIKNTFLDFFGLDEKKKSIIAKRKEAIERAKEKQEESKRQLRMLSALEGTVENTAKQLKYLEDIHQHQIMYGNLGIIFNPVLKGQINRMKFIPSKGATDHLYTKVSKTFLPHFNKAKKEYTEEQEEERVGSARSLDKVQKELKSSFLFKKNTEGLGKLTSALLGANIGRNVKFGINTLTAVAILALVNKVRSDIKDAGGNLSEILKQFGVRMGIVPLKDEKGNVVDLPRNRSEAYTEADKALGGLDFVTTEDRKKLQTFIDNGDAEGASKFIDSLEAKERRSKVEKEVKRQLDISGKTVSITGLTEKELSAYDRAIRAGDVKEAGNILQHGVAGVHAKALKDIRAKNDSLMLKERKDTLSRLNKAQLSEYLKKVYDFSFIPSDPHDAANVAAAKAYQESVAQWLVDTGKVNSKSAKKLIESEIKARLKVSEIALPNAGITPQQIAHKAKVEATAWKIAEESVPKLNQMSALTRKQKKSLEQSLKTLKELPIPEEKRKKVQEVERKNIERMYLKGDSAAEVGMYLETLSIKYRKEMFGSTIIKRQSSQARAKSLGERDAILAREWNMDRKTRKKYFEYVDKNDVEGAREFLENKRRAIVAEKPRLSNDVKGSWKDQWGDKTGIFGEIFNALYTDGSLKYWDYGLTKEQADTAKRLLDADYHFESRWYIEDALEALYAEKGAPTVDEPVDEPVVDINLFTKPAAIATAVRGPAAIMKGVVGAYANPMTKKINQFAIEDLKAVRKDLGRKQFNLLGGAEELYATRKAALQTSFKEGLTNLGKTKVGGALVRATKATGNFLSKHLPWATKAVKGIGKGLVTATVATKNFFSGKGLGGKAVKIAATPIRLLLAGLNRVLGMKRFKPIRWILTKLLKCAGKLFKLMTKFPGITTAIFFVAGIVRGLTMSEKAKKRYAAKFQGKGWKIILNVVLTLIDPYEIGIALIQLKNIIKSLPKKERKEAEADSSKVAQEKIAEVAPPKEGEEGFTGAIQEALGEDTKVGESDEESDEETKAKQIEKDLNASVSASTNSSTNINQVNKASSEIIQTEIKNAEVGPIPDVKAKDLAKKAAEEVKKFKTSSQQVVSFAKQQAENAFNATAQGKTAANPLFNDQANSGFSTDVEGLKNAAIHGKNNLSQVKTRVGDIQVPQINIPSLNATVDPVWLKKLSEAQEVANTQSQQIISLLSSIASTSMSQAATTANAAKQALVPKLEPVIDYTKKIMPTRAF